jgi:hypothetical protein
LDKSSLPTTTTSFSDSSCSHTVATYSKPR